MPSQSDADNESGRAAPREGASSERTEESPEVVAALNRARTACLRAAKRLRAASIVTEALAEYVPPRKRFLRTRPATMRPLGQVWRIGPLLLGADGDPESPPTLYTVGRATRANERGRPGYQSQSREERKELAAAALRGGYALGVAVNFDAVAVLPVAGSAPLAGGSDVVGRDVVGSDAFSSDVVGFAGGEFRVRWMAGASLADAPSLADFLEDRVSLLIDPPQASGGQ